jgi:hypothetical protein
MCLKDASFSDLSSRIDDGDLRCRSLRSRRDADHVRVSDGHHAERHVPRRRVVRASHLVDLVSLRHNDAVTLNNDGVRENAVLEIRIMIMRAKCLILECF